MERYFRSSVLDPIINKIMPTQRFSLGLLAVLAVAGAAKERHTSKEESGRHHPISSGPVHMRYSAPSSPIQA